MNPFLDFYVNSCAKQDNKPLFKKENFVLFTRLSQEIRVLWLNKTPSISASQKKTASSNSVVLSVCVLYFFFLLDSFRDFFFFLCSLCLTFYLKDVLDIFKNCDVATISFYVLGLLKLILMIEYGFAIHSIFGVFYVKNCSQEWNYNTLLLEHGNTAIWHVWVSSFCQFFSYSLF